MIKFVPSNFSGSHFQKEYFYSDYDHIRFNTYDEILAHEAEIERVKSRFDNLVLSSWISICDMNPSVEDCYLVHVQNEQDLEDLKIFLKVSKNTLAEIEDEFKSGLYFVKNNREYSELILVPAANEIECVENILNQMKSAYHAAIAADNTSASASNN